jgi:hypothetical protein
MDDPARQIDALILKTNVRAKTSHGPADLTHPSMDATHAPIPKTNAPVGLTGARPEQTNDPAGQLVRHAHKTAGLESLTHCD